MTRLLHNKITGVFDPAHLVGKMVGGPLNNPPHMHLFIVAIVGIHWVYPLFKGSLEG